MVKIKEFQEILKKKKIDFAIFCNIDFVRFDCDMAYFSGYGGIGALILPKDKKPFLIVSRDGAAKAKKLKIKSYVLPKKKRLFEFIKEKVRHSKVKSRKIGVNKEEFTLLLKDYLKKNLKKSRLMDLREELYKLREIKTKKEIEIIKKGCKISDEILRMCFKDFKKFKTEAEVKAFLEYETKKRNCELSFPTIVASGKNSSEVHHDTSDEKIKGGFCVIDFGIRYKNYCTDTTRTVYVGKPTKKDVEIYNKLLRVQKKAIIDVKVGEECENLNESVKRSLGSNAKNFIHGLGHGIGVKIHELPSLTEKSSDKFGNGQILTIEPGIYFKNFGIRIEDDILILDNRVFVLTKTRKELILV